MSSPDKEDSVRFQCIDAIEISLCIEKQGLLFYEKVARKARDSRVRGMFSRLAAEEKEHIQSLQNKSKFLQPALSRKSPTRIEVDQFISEELKGKVFPDLRGRGGDVPEVASDMEALEFGIQAEKRSIEVLSALLLRERKLDVRAIFSHLLAEERTHLAALEELKKSFLSQAV